MRRERTSRKRRLGSRSGTSIIEAAAALFVLAAFSGGACQLAISAKELSDAARSSYQAVNIAKNRVEHIQALGYDQLEMADEDRVRIDASGVPDLDGRFRRTTTTTAISADIKEVHVAVEMMNRVTLEFDGGQQEVRACMTRFENLEH